MALQTFTPFRIPDASTDREYKAKILKSEFGDGYTEYTRDGLNHIRQIVTLTWSACTPTEAKSVVDFVLAHGGTTPFWFVLPNETVPRKWTCDPGSISDKVGKGAMRDVSIKLEQSFNHQT